MPYAISLVDLGVGMIWPVALAYFILSAEEWLNSRLFPLAKPNLMVPDFPDLSHAVDIKLGGFYGIHPRLLLPSFATLVLSHALFMGVCYPSDIIYPNTPHFLLQHPRSRRD